MLSQDETPLLYSLVFGEGVVNDATSVVLFNAIQKFDLSHVTSRVALQFMGHFLFLFIASTLMGILVSTPPLFLYLSHCVNSFVLFILFITLLRMLVCTSESIQFFSLVPSMMILKVITMVIAGWFALCIYY